MLSARLFSAMAVSKVIMQLNCYLHFFYYWLNI